MHQTIPRNATGSKKEDPLSYTTGRAMVKMWRWPLWPISTSTSWCSLEFESPSKHNMYWQTWRTYPPGKRIHIPPWKRKIIFKIAFSGYMLVSGSVLPITVPNCTQSRVNYFSIAQIGKELAEGPYWWRVLKWCILIITYFPSVLLCWYSSITGTFQSKLVHPWYEILTSSVSNNRFPILFRL